MTGVVSLEILLQFLEGLHADVRRVADNDVEPPVRKHLRELGRPVEDVDAQRLLVGQQRHLLPGVKIRPDERIAALDVPAQVGQRPLGEQAKLLVDRLLVSPSSTFKSSDSLVTSTAWGSMSTPKMLLTRIRLRSPMVNRHSPRLLIEPRIAARPLPGPVRPAPSARYCSRYQSRRN